MKNLKRFQYRVLWCGRLGMRMYEATIAVRNRRDGMISVISLSQLDAALHEPLIPDVRATPVVATPTKHDTDRAIAKEIHGRHGV